VAITRRISALGALAILASVSDAHDLFFRPDSHFVASDSKIVIPVLSGTFSKSENGITRDRIEDLSIVDPSGRRPIAHELDGSRSAQHLDVDDVR